MDLKKRVLLLRVNIEKAKALPLLQKAGAVESIVSDAGDILGEVCARVERLEEVLNDG
jgi:hypothetical protein